MRLRPRFRRGTPDCRAVGRRLQSYLDGELDDHRRDDIAAHLDACRACGLEFETYREVQRSLAREQAPVPTDVLERLRRFGNDLVGGDSGSQAIGPPGP